MEIQPMAAVAVTAPAAPVQREALPALPSATAASQSQAAKAEQQPKPQPEEVKEAVKDIQDFVNTVTTDLRFTVDKETGRTIVSVVDSKTHQVVRQIPTEDIMKIARNIDRMQGLLFNDKA
jgi:flagellar protein FlaG